MRNITPSLIIRIETDSYRDDTWRYRMSVLEGSVKTHVAAGRGTPEHVMELAREALREANNRCGKTAKVG